MDDLDRASRIDWATERIPALAHRCEEIDARLSRLRGGQAVNLADVDRARTAASAAATWSRRAGQLMAPAPPTATATRRPEPTIIVLQEAVPTVPLPVPPTTPAVLTVQEALLPAAVPVLPAIDLSARYLLADRDTAAGGDWFDCVVLGGGQVALVVGDVVGHGVQAAATMAQLRSALSAYLQDGADSAAAVTRLDRFAERIPAAAAATVCAAIVDPNSGELTYCTAGHPPPLIATTTGGSGDARYLEPSGGGPLGVGGHDDHRAAQDRLVDGEVLLLYTDGIIERPSRTPGQATLELLTTTGAAAAAQIAGDRIPRRTADRVTKQVLQELTRVTGHTDDITVLAAHRRDTVQPFTRRAPALPGLIRKWRVDLDTWLDELDIDPVQAFGISHAAVEMTTNVVEHAYSDATEPGQMTLNAALSATGILEVSVRDTGTWKPPTRDHGAGRNRNDGGHGLALAGAMVDELTIGHDASGTTTCCRTRLTRPVALVTSAGQRPAEPDPVFTAEFTPDYTADFSEFLDGDRLVVAGPIDVTTARELGRALRNHMQHAIRSLTVDLSEVTHLASAGVQVLAEAIHRTTNTGPSHGAQLTLHAPAGSAAQHVLALTQLPHTTGTSPIENDTS